MPPIECEINLSNWNASCCICWKTPPSTPLLEEKYGLDFKKRGAHTHQFIISDTGCGIPEEQRENIFKAISPK